MRILRFSALLAILLVAGACGGTDSDTSSTADATASTDSSADDNASSDGDRDRDTASTTAPSSTTTDDDAGGSTDSSNDETSNDGGSGSDGASDDGAAGTVKVQLESIDGLFVEGFEIGLRFEATSGEVLASTLWSDVVASADDPSPNAFYTAVHEQQVPAGEVVVLATVNVGIGPPPETPDLTGPMACELTVDVPAGGEVDVEVAFDDSGCLREL